MNPPLPEVHILARAISDGCTECRACLFRCAFLNEYGTPKHLADLLLTTGKGLARAFECSLCGLCATVCPSRLPLPEFFLAMRRKIMDAGRVSLVPYRSLLTYETIGASRLFRLLRVPAGGDTVLFPGCTFPGMHPATARALLAHLRARIPALGLALGCCFKPSHDLGRQDYFLKRFGAMRDVLMDRGVKTVITACPNCHKVFAEYGEGLESRAVFSVLEEHPVDARVHGTAIVHTPCPFRSDNAVQNSIKRLAEGAGLTVESTRQDGSASPCCGEGGAVGALRPEFPALWAKKTAERATGRMLVTTCAGCVTHLSGHARAVHLLDLLFLPFQTVHGELQPPKGLAPYLHRLRFKSSAMLLRT